MLVNKAGISSMETKTDVGKHSWNIFEDIPALFVVLTAITIGYHIL
jgi:hypothetical protein